MFTNMSRFVVKPVLRRSLWQVVFFLVQFVKDCSDCSGEENYNLSVPVGGILGGGPDFPVRADF